MGNLMHADMPLNIKDDARCRICMAPLKKDVMQFVVCYDCRIPYIAETLEELSMEETMLKVRKQPDVAFRLGINILKYGEPK